jgi:hypothetical protein
MAQDWHFYDVRWHICHSWQDIPSTIITAMTTFTAFLAIAAIAVVLAVLIQAVVGDGYGHRPPPPSRLSDLEPGSPAWWAHLSH